MTLVQGRAITVLSVIWLSAVIILSAVLRDFRWMGLYTSDPALGPAAVTAICGEVILVAAVFGAPWIFEAFHKGTSEDK